MAGRSEALRIKGRVFSGKGEGAKYMGLPWVREQLAQKLGFTPYPGTLNIRLDSDQRLKLREELAKTDVVRILPAPGFFHGRCFEVRLAIDLECFIVSPEIQGYPENVVELIAAKNLRIELGLKDGDEIDFIVAPQ